MSIVYNRPIPSDAYTYLPIRLAICLAARLNACLSAPARTPTTQSARADPHACVRRADVRTRAPCALARARRHAVCKAGLRGQQELATSSLVLLRRIKRIKTPSDRLAVDAVEC